MNHLWKKLHGLISEIKGLHKPENLLSNIDENEGRYFSKVIRDGGFVTYRVVSDSKELAENEARIECNRIEKRHVYSRVKTDIATAFIPAVRPVLEINSGRERCVLWSDGYISGKWRNGYSILSNKYDNLRRFPEEVSGFFSFTSKPMPESDYGPVNQREGMVVGPGSCKKTYTELLHIKELISVEEKRFVDPKFRYRIVVIKRGVFKLIDGSKSEMYKCELINNNDYRIDHCLFDKLESLKCFLSKHANKRYFAYDVYKIALSAL